MTNKEMNDLRIDLLLSAQRALLGVINVNILGVYIENKIKDVKLVVYVEGELSSEEVEALEIACTEMNADVYPSRVVSLKIIENSVDPLISNGMWVFLRYGVATKSMS